jgi:hypothetical protein
VGSIVAHKLDSIFSKFHLIRAKEKERPDVLFYHWDRGPIGEGMITEDEIINLNEVGTICISYTAGVAKWEVYGPNHFSGSFLELKSRLSLMSEPVTLEELRWALELSDTKLQWLDTQLELLAALAVLCQGYLAAHSCPDGTPDLPLDHEAYSPSAKALEVMGYKSFCDEQQQKQGSIHWHISPDDVKKKIWWRTVFIGTKLQSILEIDHLKNIKISAITDLIKSFWNENGTLNSDKVESISPQLVSHAYLEIIAINNKGKDI